MCERGARKVGGKRLLWAGADIRHPDSLGIVNPSKYGDKPLCSVHREEFPRPSDF